MRGWHWDILLDNPDTAIMNMRYFLPSCRRSFFSKEASISTSSTNNSLLKNLHENLFLIKYFFSFAFFKILQMFVSPANKKFTLKCQFRQNLVWIPSFIIFLLNEELLHNLWSPGMCIHLTTYETLNWMNHCLLGYHVKEAKKSEELTLEDQSEVAIFSLPADLLYTEGLFRDHRNCGKH